MPKAKPVSLHPLSFEEAIKTIIRTEPHHAKKTQTLPKKKKRNSPK